VARDAGRGVGACRRRDQIMSPADWLMLELFVGWSLFFV
jgi:hypothetical protein